MRERKPTNANPFSRINLLMPSRGSDTPVACSPHPKRQDCRFHCLQPSRFDVKSSMFDVGKSCFGSGLAGVRDFYHRGTGNTEGLPGCSFFVDASQLQLVSNQQGDPTYDTAALRVPCVPVVKNKNPRSKAAGLPLPRHTIRVIRAIRSLKKKLPITRI